MTARTWVTPGGLRIRLAHLTHTSRKVREGWWLITTSPDSGFVISETWLGLELDPEVERSLLDGLASVQAVPVIP